MGRGAVALAQGLTVEDTRQQPGQLSARVATGALQIAQHHAFIGAIEPCIAKALGDRGNVSVALVVAGWRRKPYLQRAGQKS